MKQMMRKLFALLMAAMMLCGSLPLDALAEESENTRTDYSETGTIYDQIGDDLLDQDGTPEPTSAPTVFALELTRPEGAPLYGTMNEDYVFDYAIEGCAAETCALSWRVEFAGAEPETGVIADDIAVENGAAAGEFTYQPKQEGVYRLTMAAAVPENSELVAEDQLALVVVDPEKKEYLCGKEEHTHTDACYAMAQGGDDSGPGIEVDGVFESLQPSKCPVGYEHTHIDACLPQCGQISHTHVEECKDADGNLICGLEEHTHGPECLGEQPENVEGADETDLNAIINGNTYKLDGGTYKLTNHLTTTDIIQIDGDVTINLYDYNITRQAPASGKMGYVFQLDSTEDKLTIKGNGTITNNANDMFHVDNGTLVLEGGTFTGCSADTIYAKNANVTIEDGVTITGNTNYSPVYANTDTVLIMTGGEIRGNTVNKAGEETNVGGGVKLKGAKFTMTGGEISGNTAGVSGGGVYVENSTFTMTGGTITRNNATVNHGGGVYLIGSSSFEMTGGEISNNIAKQYGGGVYFAQDSTGSLTMTNSKIADNTAGVGGGVYLNKGVSFAMNGGEISGNTTTDTSNGSGGGVYFAAGSTGSFTMDGGKITGNKTATSQNGGGLYFNGSNAVEINNAKISDNTAGYGGGGIYFAQGYNGTFTMTGSTVTGNNAQQGGGVCVQNIGFTISGGEISHNTAESTTETGYSGSGGGIFCTNCDTVTLDGGVLIDNNTASNTEQSGKTHGNGGGVYFETCKTVKIDGATISNNTATAAGGGLAFNNSNDISINKATIDTNTSGGWANNGYAWGGGGIVTIGSNDGHMSIKNTDINRNISEYRNGGGMFIGESMNVTISGTSHINNNKTNTPDDWGGGGIFVNQGGSLTIENALITGNHAEGFGGGVAGCSTGQNHLVYDGGAGIYDNEAKGTALSGPSSAKPKDHWLRDASGNNYDGGPAGRISSTVVEKRGDDYFCAETSDISGVMLGGGDPKWSGYGSNAPKADGEQVNITHGGRASTSYYMVLTAHPSPEDKAAAEAAATVFIQGNTSSVHGGGIMNNGVLFLGKADKAKGTGYAPQVKKEINGNSAPEKTFTFQLLDKDGRQIGDTVTVKGKGYARFAMIDYTEADIYTYTIKEVHNSADDEWEYDSSEWEVTVHVTNKGNQLEASATYSKKNSGETSDECATFTNTYTPKGGLTVSKTVTGNAGDTEKLFYFRVELSDTSVNGTYGTGDKAMSFTDGTAEFTLKDGQSKTATGLPAGITYTVKEDDYSSDGYTTSSTTPSGTIPTGDTATAAFTNEKNTGDLTVSKTVTGEGDRSKSFNFRVELSDTSITGTYGTGDTAMQFTNGVATFELKHGQSKTATGLPAGITYSVTETEANQDGYTTTSEGASGTIPANGTAEAQFVNNKPEPDTGSLAVTKRVTGKGGEQDKEFGFTVVFDPPASGSYTIDSDTRNFTGDSVPFNLKANQTATFSDLPVNTQYTVTETDYSSDGYTTSWTVGDAPVEGDKVTGKITDSGSAISVVCTNDKPAPKTGDLTVSKTVAGAGDTDRAFSFTVTLSDTSIGGEYGDMTFTGGKAEFTLKHGESKTATGLPAGITYTVTEAEADQDGYTTKSTGATGTIPTNGTGKAEFTNDKPAPKTGDLTVRKTVAGAGDTEKEFNFTVKLTGEAGESISGTYGGMTFTNGVAHFTLKHNESVTATGLPVGVKYTVTETEADQDGYKTTYTGATGEIRENGHATATFTNTRATGGLTVKKTVAGRGGETTRDFHFTVTLDDASISGTYGGMTFDDKGIAEFTLRDDQHRTATGLPVGVKYTVTETRDDGYTTTYSRIAGINPAGPAKGTIAEGDPAEVTVTNTRKLGGLIVKKLVEGEDAESSKEKEFNFTVELSDKTINGTYFHMSFTNGVAKFTLKNGETRTATELPAGVEYTVTEEHADGYSTTYRGATGTIEENETAEVTVTNTRETGDLRVTKHVVGDDSESSKKFDFTVTLSDETINGQYFHMQFTNGVAKFTLGNGETRTATGLPVGTKYTVAETGAAGYQVTYTGETGEITAGTRSEAVFTNTREKGNLSVTKKVEGVDGDHNKEFAFTVELVPEYSGTFGQMEFKDGVAEFTLKNGEMMTATGLPIGTKYTVTESDDEDYTASWTGATGTIASETPQTAAFTNTRKTGDLAVTKTVTGEGGDKTKEFNFTVTLSDAGINGEYGGMEFTDGTAKFTLTDGQTMQATGLPVGVTYTVREAEANKDGYTTSWVGGVVSAKGDAVTGEIEERDNGSAISVVCTNKRPEPETGNLTVRKTVEGEGGDTEQAFNFNVTLDDASINGTYGGMTFADGAVNFSLKHGQFLTATGLPAGVEYTVTEEHADGYTATYSGATGMIEENKTAEVIVTNTRDTGDLRVTKQVEGDNPGPNEEFHFTVTLGDETINGTYEHMTFTNGVAEFTLKNGETRTATGLPTGTTYTVEETGANGYQAMYAGETGKITKGTLSEAVVTNTREKGNLIVTKTVEGADGDLTKEFKFSVTLDDTSISGEFGEMYFENGVAEFTLKHGGKKTATGLPIGTEYTVTETDNEGYTVSETGAKGTIASDTPRTAAFTNTRETGDLAVTKTVTGDGGDREKEFNFTITLDDASINGEYGGMEFTNGSANFTLKDGQTMRATGLPAGAKYTVTEDDYSSEGYTTSVGDGDETRETRGTIPANGTASAAFKNDRPEPETGSLEVTKTVTGTGGDRTKKFNFTVTLSDTSINDEYGDMTFVNGVATFTLMDGWSKTASGLPVGVKYTVTEAEANQDGYTTSATGETGEITENGHAMAAFTNAREIGGLTVTKTVAGTGGDRTKEFNFTVTLSDASINGEYGRMTFESGEATFKLKHGQSLSASGLPAGVTYTVTEAEANKDGYTTTYSGETGEIEENKTAEVTVTNEREIGDLSVTKTVTGEGGDASKEFHFTVRLNDASINGQYGDMMFTNGVASVTLKSGESATASGLPAGVGYTVTEAEADADGYTTSATGETGTIPAKDNAEAAFVNDKPEPDAGSLTVTKTVTGEGGDTTKEFHFTVTLGDRTINGAYGDMKFTNGVASFTLTSGQSATASGLPVGVSYTVVETEANKDNYTTSSTGTSGTIPKNGDAMATFVNDKPAGETVSRTVRKIWIGDENNTGVRPYSIQVQLYQNGAVYGSAVTLYAGNSWEHTWTDLPAKDANGAAYRYTVVELAQLRDYTTSYSGDTFTITNTYTPPVTRRTVRKIWADVDNLDGSRPASVVVQLTADGRNYGQPVTLYAGNNWSYTWTNLPVYRDSTNAQVNYSVVETPVPTGYTSVVTNNGYEILVTNTHTPGPVDISVTKAWDDGDNKDELRPESVTVQLLADGVVIDTVVLNAVNNWTHSWTGMEASRNGRKIVYSVNEVPIPEKYTATVSSVETAKGRAFTIVNRYTPMPETTELSGTKIWVDQSDALGLRPDSIEVQLYQNGALLLGQTPEWTKEGNVWTYRFKDLPYADQDHKPYTYTVQETPVEGYRSEVNGTTIINTLLSREISISGTKTWRDNDNADGIRPTQITVRLLRDGVEIATKTVTAAEGWSYTFENLPESDPATGRIYQYQISEVLVNGYYMQTDGYNLINIELPRNNPGPGPEPGTGTRTYIVPGPGPGGTPVQPTVVIQDYEPPLGITQWGTPTEEELEDQVEIDEYKTPLWGELLQTGDDLPLYPFVSGGIGVLALLALLMDRKKRKNRQ